MSEKPKIPWYKDGLRFKCTGCGKCCTGAPGYVWLNERDIERLSSHFELSREEFLRRYTRYTNGAYSLKEVAKTFDCILLSKKSCSAYTARPEQCRLFPWWPENLSSKEAWEEAGKSCEGINHPEAPLTELAEIYHSGDNVS